MRKKKKSNTRGGEGMTPVTTATVTVNKAAGGENSQEYVRTNIQSKPNYTFPLFFLLALFLFLLLTTSPNKYPDQISHSPPFL